MNRKVVIVLCVTGLARVALVMGKSWLGSTGWQIRRKTLRKTTRTNHKTKMWQSSSKMKRNLSKKEEDAAFRRKNRQDPNPDRKGKQLT